MADPLNEAANQPAPVDAQAASTASEGQDPKQKKAPGLASRLLDAALWIGALGVFAVAMWPKDSGPSIDSLGPPLDLPLVGEEGRFIHEGERERPLLIEAFASWCGACKRSNYLLDPVREAAAAGKLDIIAISVDDDPSAALAAKRQWPVRVPVAHDESGVFNRSYRIEVLPTYILVGRDGKVLRVTSGPPGASDLRSWLNTED